MQKLFREELINSVPSPSYATRVHQFRESLGKRDPQSPIHLMQEFVQSNVLALEHLKANVDLGDLERAIDIIEASHSVYLVGLRRSFPVVAYLAYALPHVAKATHLIDGLAGMIVEQSSMISERDALIAVSFRPYAQETPDIVARAHAARARIITISDSLLSPVARQADVSFEVSDAEVMNFRSLTASFCLAQTLVIGLAHRVDARQNSA
jgi:DNA-binding MurR/RpiR family transcriptional regulator